MLDRLIALRDFSDKGGPIFSTIFLFSIFLWLLILQRYWFIYITYPKQLKQTIHQWQQRTDRLSWSAIRIRDTLLTGINISLQHNLLPIKALISILPLLGLLGTVTGMIAIFETINQFGFGNTKAMAEGIGRALLPSAAGLVTAIIGIHFSVDLERHINTKLAQAKDLLI